MHVLDNGICVTCQPAHVLEDGECVTCSRTAMRFDPHEPREPHSGKWVKGLGGGSNHEVAKKLLAAIDEGDDEEILKQGELLDKPTFDALTPRQRKDIIDEFDGTAKGKAVPKQDRDRAKKILDKLNGKTSEPKRTPKAAPKPAPALPKATPKLPPAKAVPSTAPAHQGSDAARLAETVRHGQIRKEEYVSRGAMADTRKRTYADGTETIWKQAGDLGFVSAKQQSDAEEIGSALARSLGLRAPAVYRENDSTVSIRFVGNATVDAELPEVRRGDKDTDEGRMMGLLDLLMNNTDRNRGNWLHTDGEHHLIPIDHGYAFAYPDDPSVPSRLLRSDFTTPYFDVFDTAFIDNDLTPGDVADIRRRLVALEPEFQRVGRGDWFDFALTRLDAIAPYAKGTKSRLLPAVS